MTQLAVLAAALTLAACSRSSDPSAPARLQPTSAEVATGGTVTFTALSDGAPVTWTVQESGGGTVDAHGVYTAPATEGTFHVTASTGTTALGVATVVVRRAGAGPDEPPPPPAGPQLYVATSGNDANPGTLDLPWRTIQKAMNAATPGSTVNIRGGTYAERLVLNVSGDAGAPITFQPYGFAGSAACGGATGVACAGEPVVLDYGYLGTVTDGVPFLRISGRQHVVIQGLTFQNLTCSGPMQQGVRIDGATDDVQLRWCRFVRLQNTNPNFDNTGALLAARVWGPASNVRFYGCEFDTIRSNMSEALTFTGNSTGAVVERSYFHDTDGIALSTYDGASQFTFRNNRFAWCGVKRDGTYWYNNPAVALYNDGGHDGVFEGNILTDGAYAIESMPETAHFGMPGQPDAYNMVIRNNVILRHGYAGIVVGTWYSNTDGSSVATHDVYNNTIHDSAVGILVRPFNADSTRVRNNIFSSCRSPYSNPLGWGVAGAFDYNLYTGGGAGPDVHKILSDPMFVDPGAENFSLAPGSPAIGAGDPSTGAQAGTVDFLGQPRFSGTIDLGAIESQ